MPTLKVELKTRDGNKTVSVPSGATVADVIATEKANPETFIINLNGKIAHPATALADGDALEFVHVIYGG
jgi:thiamine biosynthesis protein ThiS